jgi:hypothetical protein
MIYLFQSKVRQHFLNFLNRSSKSYDFKKEGTLDVKPIVLFAKICSLAAANFFVLVLIVFMPCINYFKQDAANKAPCVSYTDNRCLCVSRTPTAFSALLPHVYKFCGRQALNSGKSREPPFTSRVVPHKKNRSFYNNNNNSYANKMCCPTWMLLVLWCLKWLQQWILCLVSKPYSCRKPCRVTNSRNHHMQPASSLDGKSA